jgi:hypothetical protein
LDPTLKMGFFGMAASYLAFSVLHFFLFIFALTVAGLYGVDLDNARKAGKYADSKWVSLKSTSAVGVMQDGC